MSELTNPTTSPAESEAPQLDPYEQLVLEVAAEADRLGTAMNRRRATQLRGYAIGALLLRRGQHELELTNGAIYETTTFFGSAYYAGIRTPLVGVQTDQETGAQTGWAFELRERTKDGYREFFTEKEANQPEQYWQNYSSSPMYVLKTVTDPEKPEDRESELWYTIYSGDQPLVISADAANDTEQQERKQAYITHLLDVGSRFKHQFPELVAIDAEYKADLEAATEKYGPGEDSALFDSTPTSLGRARDLATARFVNKKGEFDFSPRGQELQRLEDEAAEAGDFGVFNRAGQAAVEHCQSLLELAQAELHLG